MVALSKSRVFCPACGLQVEPALGMEGDYRTVSCSMCDLLLESKPNPDAPPPPPIVTGSVAQAPAMRAPAVAPTGGIATRLDTVMAAEDTDGIRKMLVKLLMDRGIARNVIAAANGEELLIGYHRAVAAGQPVNLLILDVNMPILNGINAAIGVRAAERAASLPPTPILYFTSALCDESFKRVLQFTAPARYLNKGAEGTPEQFAERLVAVLASLLNMPGSAPLPAGV